jgi:hypothetical protein
LIAGLEREPSREKFLSVVETRKHLRGLEGSFRDVLWERLESWRDSVGSASDRGGLCRGGENEGSQSGLPLDPALAEVLFAWKRASVFGQDVSDHLKTYIFERLPTVRCRPRALRGSGIAGNGSIHRL